MSCSSKFRNLSFLLFFLLASAFPAASWAQPGKLAPRQIQADTLPALADSVRMRTLDRAALPALRPDGRQRLLTAEPARFSTQQRLERQFLYRRQKVAKKINR